MLRNFCLSTVILSLTLASTLLRAETAKSAWAHESQVSIVTSSGNTTSETYAGRQKTSYSLETSKLTLTGGYLDGRARQTDKTSGVTTEVKSRRWDAGIRYDYDFTPVLGAFVGLTAESDPNAGYVQRDSTDLGGKYLAFKDTDKSLQTEAGLRYSKTYDGTNVDYTTFGRLYLEYNQALSSDVSFKFWLEHLPNLKDSDKYLTNAELSLAVSLSSIFSLKSAYLAKYHNYATSSALYEDKRLDSVFTTALVAKF